MNTERAFPNALPELTRKEKFELWKSRSRRSAASLARVCGLSEPIFSQMIRSETMPAWHHLTLLDAGVPEDCLPRPVIHKKGP
jgi:hypothetical protein